MAAVLINPESLAHHLEVAGEKYRMNVATMQEAGQQRLAEQFELQRGESLRYAAVIRGARSLSWEGEFIEIVTD